jgi:DNA-binding transcriptional MerR regulator
MNVAEGWNMYLEIQDLKEMHFNVSQISRRLDLSRTTVYKYLDMTLEEMEQILEKRKTRTKKHDLLICIERAVISHGIFSTSGARRFTQRLRQAALHHHPSCYTELYWRGVLH